MSSQSYINASDALPNLLHKILKKGELVESRNGQTRELLMEQFTLRKPTERYITTPGRRVSLPAQIAETMWLLAGRNDIGWLENYLPRAKDFSDDGQIWRGAYGPRIRKWQPVAESGRPWSHEQKVDQLAHVVKLLTDDPGTRRAVITIYDPAIDTQPGKDIPCNNWVHFVARDGRLHGHVTIRSNDVFWGWSGINQFEWSALLEIVAGLTKMQVGTLTFSVSSLHLYERHFKRGQELADTMRSHLREEYRISPQFKMPEDSGVAGLDALVDRWFRVEKMIREEPRGSAWHHIKSFPEPMMRSWLFALYAWWHGRVEKIFEVNHELHPLRGTDLYAALVLSPKRKVPEPVLPEKVWANALTKSEYEGKNFVEFVAKLHEEKHTAYGDSWKKRGEMLGIMANIARKMDRLGVAGGGDTAADTAIDLLVYLVKYRLWLSENDGAILPAGLGDVSTLVGNLGNLTEQPDYVTRFLHTLAGCGRGVGPDALTIASLEARFRRLEEAVNAQEARHRIVDHMIDSAYQLALRLWTKEQKEAWKAENDKRIWKGYDA